MADATSIPIRLAPEVPLTDVPAAEAHAALAALRA